MLDLKLLCEYADVQYFKVADISFSPVPRPFSLADGMEKGMAKEKQVKGLLYCRSLCYEKFNCGLSKI